MVKSYEDPTKANLQSIKVKDTISLIKEAYRIHEEVFTHIIGNLCILCHTITYTLPEYTVSK